MAHSYLPSEGTKCTRALSPSLCITPKLKAKWSERTRRGALYQKPAATDTITTWTYCHPADRRSVFLCACLRGTHCVMRRIWLDTSHSCFIAGVEDEEEEEEGRWIIQAASSALGVVSYREVRWAGNNKQHLRVTWQPRDRASKEARFSGGQGIISENNSCVSKWQPSLQHSVADIWSITPHTQDKMTALPQW